MPGLIVALTAILLASGGSVAFAQDGYKYQGAASCSASTCHSAPAPWMDTSVSPKQHEYVIWQQHDPHARAYDSLKTDLALQIARNLGLGQPQQETMCLDCHANNAPEHLRAGQFDITEGVSCEACHGPAEGWMKLHFAGDKFPQDNYAVGMYPITDPNSRARLCLSCHYGNDSKQINHRLLGAGHPRTPFELDTYGLAQPAHYRLHPDHDRAVRTWAFGQAVHASKLLDRFLQAMAQPGLMPGDLSMFDCHACHRQIDQLTQQSPGRPRLNDAHFIMAGIIAEQSLPRLANELEQNINALHQARSRDNARRAAEALRSNVETLVNQLDAVILTPAITRKMLNSIIDQAVERRQLGYLYAEQAIMAIATLNDALQFAGEIDASASTRIERALQACYAATADEHQFKPADVHTCFTRIRNTVARTSE